MAKFNLFPRDDKFFHLFEASANNMLLAAESMKKLVGNWDSIDKYVDELTKIEHDGDSITHEIMSQLNRSFITPFDREDVVMLAHSLDDVTDLIQAAGDAMLLYRVKSPRQRAQQLADVLVQITTEVDKAIPHLRKHTANMQKIMASCVEINRLENLGDQVYRAALGELFAETVEVPDIIKWRDIYEHMESATDRCEDVANVLESVALKHA